MFESGEVEAMGSEELIDALRRAHGAAAFAQAAEITAIREVYRRHRAENAAPGPGGVQAGQFAAAEVAVAVQVSEGVAAALVDIGLALDSLPQTKLAFASGRIDLSRVQVIAESMRGLSRELRETLEPKLIDAATRSDPARLRQTARRWVIRLDPAGEQRRREEREADRDIRIRAVQSGMAVFEGLLPAAGAQTLAMRLREMSMQVCVDDPRTMPQRRADALVALADGTSRLTCRCAHAETCPAATAPTTPRRPLIQVGIPADTLLGLRDDPAFLSGYGPIDPALARTLAEHARFQVIPEYFPEAAADQHHSNPHSATAETEDPMPVRQQQPRPAPTDAVDPERARQRRPRRVTGDATDSTVTPLPFPRAATTGATSSADPNPSAPHSITAHAAVPERAFPQSARPKTAGSAPWERFRPRPAVAATVTAESTNREELQPVPAYAVDRGHLVPAVNLRPFSAAPPREIRAIDALCRFPGCTMPAAETVLAQFDALRPLRALLPPASARAVLCTHHHRLKALADTGKHPWRVYLANTDRMRWIDPTGEPHETIREGARYLFPHTDIDAPAKPTPTPFRRPLPPEDLPLTHPYPADIAYPLHNHPLIHPQLAHSTPENNISYPARVTTR